MVKGLGFGVFIGVCMVGGRVVGLFGLGNYGLIFGGNLLVCIVVLIIIDVIE